MSKITVSGMGDLVGTGTVDDNPSPYLALAWIRRC